MVLYINTVNLTDAVMLVGTSLVSTWSHYLLLWAEARLLIAKGRGHR